MKNFHEKMEHTTLCGSKSGNLPYRFSISKNRVGQLLHHNWRKFTSIFFAIVMLIPTYSCLDEQLEYYGSEEIERPQNTNPEKNLNNTFLRSPSDTLSNQEILDLQSETYFTAYRNYLDTVVTWAAEITDTTYNIDGFIDYKLPEDTSYNALDSIYSSSEDSLLIADMGYIDSDAFADVAFGMHTNLKSILDNYPNFENLTEEDVSELFHDIVTDVLETQGLNECEECVLKAMLRYIGEQAVGVLLSNATPLAIAFAGSPIGIFLTLLGSIMAVIGLIRAFNKCCD